MFYWILRSYQHILLQIKKIVKTTFTSKVIMFEKTLKFKNIIIIYYGRHKIYSFTTKNT
jgi:hypothetical protein